MAEIVGNIIYNNQKGNRVYKDYELIYYVGQLYKSKDVSEITVLTQAEYDNLVVKDPKIIYVIVQEGSTIEELEARIQELTNQVNSVTSLEIKRNGTYTAPTGVLGYNNITVNVEGAEKLLVPDGMKFRGSTVERIPDNFDFSMVTDGFNLFRDCENLELLPTTVSMVGSNKSNTTIYNLDTLDSLCNGCKNLYTVFDLYAPAAYSMSYTFFNCEKLLSIGTIHSQNVLFMDSLFSGCRKLNAIIKIYLENVVSAENMFKDCINLTIIGVTGSIKVGIDFSACKLDFDSIKSILTGYSKNDASVANGKKTIKFNSNITIVDQYDDTYSKKILETLVKTCTSQGWIISGLDLM